MRQTISPFRFSVPIFFPLVALFIYGSMTQLNAQSFTEEFSIWPTDLKINGTVIACTGQTVDADAVKIFDRSGGVKKGKFVFLWFDTGLDGNEFKQILDRKEGVQRYGETAESPIELETLTAALADATGVMMFSSQPLIPEAEKLLDQIRDELHHVIDEGGVVGGVGPIVGHFGKVRHQSIHEMSMMLDDLELIPDAIVYGGYLDDEDRNFMFSGLASKPYSVGIGIPANTSIVLKGRKIRVYGKNKATFALMANERTPVRIKQIGEVTGRRTSPYDSMIDLTAWRRDAIERQLPPFPVADPPVPNVEKGTLFIVGGGGLPEDMMKDFVERAGGEDAHLIYIPCSEQDEKPVNDRLINQWESKVKQWESMGVASTTIFHTKDRNKANSDEGFLAPLKGATGIWFGGGRQWNFADSYYGTEAHKLMKEVLARGGVIGGSSAGASIQGDYLARANPVANFDIMAPGYERGLGFITGVAIDQHFSQRGRQKDMTQLADRYPQLLGIGIDETTALIVEGSKAEIVGKGKVFFYNRGLPVVPGEDDFGAVEAGTVYDLAKRELVADESPSEPEQDACDQ